jgi:hypothetical protein
MATPDLYASIGDDPILNIKTHYEEIFSKEGKLITYMKFKLAHSRPILELNPEDSNE